MLSLIHILNCNNRFALITSYSFDMTVTSNWLPFIAGASLHILSDNAEYEFSGTMDAGNIRDRIEKPMPLLKKRSLVNRIVEFIRQHTEKYQ